MSTSLKKSFPAGTIAKWSVSAENFHTSSGEVFLNDDTTLNIVLKDSRISFEWDGGGTKTVWFGNKKVTSTSPILIGNDGPMTQIDYNSNDKSFNPPYPEMSYSPNIPTNYRIVTSRSNDTNNVGVITITYTGSPDNTNTIPINDQGYNKATITAG